MGVVLGVILGRFTGGGWSDPSSSALAIVGSWLSVPVFWLLKSESMFGCGGCLEVSASACEANVYRAGKHPPLVSASSATLTNVPLLLVSISETHPIMVSVNPSFEGR